MLDSFKGTEGLLYLCWLKESEFKWVRGVAVADHP